MIDVRVQAAAFDPGQQLARLGELKPAALACFVGRARAGEEVERIFIDHHSGLARQELQRIAEEAQARWGLAGVVLIHRHGRLPPNECILLAAVAGPEVAGTGEACNWIVGQARTRAPFWRKEKLADGSSRWREPGVGD